MPETHAGKRRLVAIMFTDVVGFTALAQRSESLALDLLDEHRQLVRSLLEKHAGHEIKTIGDAFLMEFASSLDAVRCAAAIQAAMSEANAQRPEDGRIQIRIGIHLGDVIHRGGDVDGDAVNIASRIQPLAYPGGICVTAPVQASVVNKVDYAFESMGRPDLKNVSIPIEVFRLQGFGRLKPDSKVLPKDRIAILPFTNISPDPADAYFADGMTEELIASVSQSRGLRVIARTSVMRYKGTGKPVTEIGRELNVGTVLEGSVRKAGSKLRISVQLVDTADEEPHWSQNYDRQLEDVFAIQSDIARMVTEELRQHVLGIAPAAPAGTPTHNTKAFLAYLTGRQSWSRSTEEELKRSIEFFERAIDVDPDYARASCGLADSYSTLALLDFMPAHEAHPKVREAVSHALALDPKLADAHTSLGMTRFYYDWDWAGAEEEFRRSVELNPSYVPAYQNYAELLKALGRFDEADVQLQRAIELDPLSLAVSSDLGGLYYFRREYDRAIEQYQRAADLNPAFIGARLWFARPYLQKGMFDEAVSALESTIKESGDTPVMLSVLGHALGAAGRRDEALKIVERLQEISATQYVPPYWIAVIYNGLHDMQNMLPWLRKAVDERTSWLVWINVEPRFDWARGDPDFAAVLEPLHFPK